MPPYHQSYGMQQPGAGSHSQYPARPMPNHVPHSQFPGFQVSVDQEPTLSFLCSIKNSMLKNVFLFA